MSLQRAFLWPSKIVTVVSIILAAVILMSFAIKSTRGIRDPEIDSKDSVASVRAFMEVYKVLMSPRCMNCHPAGDIPLQGDNSQFHTMSPRRGKDGHGVYAMKCNNCHQPTNSTGLNTPPGNPKWALPPANMKIVFEGRTPRQLALQIMDYKRNGHKNKAQLLAHARDTLVKAGWTMGEGRKPPPLTYDQFVIEWDNWINKGGYAPKQ